MIERFAMRWRMAGLLLAVIVIVALPYVVNRASSEAALGARDWVSHTAEVRAQVFQLSMALRDSEAAIYTMASGAKMAPDLVERSERARKLAPAALANLRTLVVDNPEQMTRIGALESVANGRVVLNDQAMQRLRSGDTQSALASMEDGRRLFAFNDLTDQIIREEDGLLAARKANAEKLATNNGIVMMIAAVAQMLLLGIVVFVSERQIARRLRAEHSAEEAVQRSLLIVQAVREPIAMLDGNLRTLLVNAAFGELYGIDVDHGRSLPLAEIGEGAWSDSALQQRLTDVAVRDRELWDYELTQRTVDGVDRFVVINARRLQQPDSGTPAVLLTVSDVTARALVEQRANELNRQLEGKVQQISDVNRELEAFSYSVSHDLRAPLRHIAGFAGKLGQHLGEGVDEKTVHYLDVIGGSARRMAQLIDDLLVFSRLGRGALRLQAVDMQSVVDEAKHLVETEAGDRKVEWRIAPLPMVVGDENMLRTVWQNLLGNAVKYTGGRDRATIEVGSKRSPNGDYEFSVADNGAGFDMQYAGKLFGVFQRLHKASDFPGNGIGLANVRRIIARHGGRTWAEGVPDQGATFHFSLPPSDAYGRVNTGDT
ncbi:MAG TPA: ATP-binding protein [Luteibacter sp.]|jgi:PAS domain S-box-containing protein|nr:ATP-binding protein [Luteibacter sp.]